MAGSYGVQLIKNGTTSSALAAWPGGRGVFSVVASAFGGATIKLQMLGPDGASLLDVGGTALTLNGAAAFDLAPCQIQATVVGGPPTAVYASVSRVVS
jgi:hypothetical protein